MPFHIETIMAAGPLPCATDDKPASDEDADQTGNEMKLTDALLISVGFLQFAAVAAAVFVAWRQTNLSRIQLIATHRPLLRVRRFRHVQSAGDDRISATFMIVNLGNTDANLKESRGGIDFIPPSFIPMPEYATLPPIVQPMVLAPGDRYEASILDRPDKSRGVILRIYGFLSYTDGLGNVRTTAFCRLYNNGTGRFERVNDDDVEYED